MSSATVSAARSTKISRSKCWMSSSFLLSIVLISLHIEIFAHLIRRRPWSSQLLALSRCNKKKGVDDDYVVIDYDGGDYDVGSCEDLGTLWDVWVSICGYAFVFDCCVLTFVGFLDLFSLISLLPLNLTKEKSPIALWRKRVAFKEKRSWYSKRCF